MPVFHSGYYIYSKGRSKSPNTISKTLFSDQAMVFVKRNYSAKDWWISWRYDEVSTQIEFMIHANNQGIAQHALFSLLCASSVLEGTAPFSNDPHYPHPKGTDFESPIEMDLIYKPRALFCSDSVPYYFKIACQVSFSTPLSNAIAKFQLSTEIYSRHYMDLDNLAEWKVTSFHYVQIRFAFAIIAAYSVIEELELGIKASKDNPSRLDNGDWNPTVFNELTRRLEASNVNTAEPFYWTARGIQTKIEKARPFKKSHKVYPSLHESAETDPVAMVYDAHVSIQDAILHISYLRSSISSHRVGDRIFDLSIYDVTNAQLVARRIILEVTGLWRKNN